MSTPAPPSGQVEQRTIEHVPVDERHGRARDLFTVWFGSNIMLLTIITGALATTVFGLPLWAGALAIVLGNVIGGVVMALHAAQGPQMGVPQMLQTRAQFGSYGSLLVVVLVVFMYLGFFASNAVLGGQALAKVTGLPTNWSIVIIGLISVVATIVGYRLIHRVDRVAVRRRRQSRCSSRSSGSSPSTACPRRPGTPADSRWAGFMATLSVAALWQIAYAPYVSDYTRYMPKDTGQRAAFWGTYTGCVLGSVLPMLLGVLVGAALPADDTLDGLSTLTRGVSTGVFAIFAIGITATNAMNLYCGDSVDDHRRPEPLSAVAARCVSRAVTAIVLFVITMIPALVSADDFLANYANFLALLLCVLIPWTAVNLVDYYLLRHGVYDIAALFERDGGDTADSTGSPSAATSSGIRVQIPFLSTTLFTGFAAKAHRRCRHLVDRRARRHLPAVLRADAPAGMDRVRRPARRGRRRPRRDRRRLPGRRRRHRRMHCGGATFRGSGRHGHRDRAGPSDEHEPRARDIRRWAEMLEGEYDLDYRSVAQQRGNSHIRQARMRILGGCSTANTMITWRPLPADLDEWVALGAAGGTPRPRCTVLRPARSPPITPVADEDRNPYVADVVDSARGPWTCPPRRAWNSDPDFAETGIGCRFLRDRLHPCESSAVLHVGALSARRASPHPRPT